MIPFNNRCIAVVTVLLSLCLADAQADVVLDRSAGPVGIYRLDDGRKLYLSPLVDENGATLQFALSDGLQGRARKAAPDEFVDTAACPHRLRILSARAIEFQECEHRFHGALTEPMEERPFTLTASDGQVLGASVWQVAGRRARRAVVLAHGADDETRQMGVIIAQLVEAGLVVVTFDQRGTGESGGHWRSDGIGQIAADMALAARTLELQGNVDAIGFFGFSNGGWVAPAAAMQFGHPDFVLIKSGDAGSVEQNVLFETATAVSASAGPAAGQRARSVMQTLLHALHSDQEADWALAQQSLLEVQDQSWLGATQLPPATALPLPGPVKEGFRRQLFFDPRGDLQQLRCPVLVMLGEQDIDVDAPRSAALYRRYFEQSGNARARILLLKNAGHQLVQGPGAAANNSMEPGRYAQQYPRAMVEWLAQIALPATHRHGSQR